MFNLIYFIYFSTVEPCKETEKSSEKGDTDSPLAKTEDKENKPGIHVHAVNPSTGTNGTITVLFLESKVILSGSSLYRCFF